MIEEPTGASNADRIFSCRPDQKIRANRLHRPGLAVRRTDRYARFDNFCHLAETSTMQTVSFAPRMIRKGSLQTG
jgi:predicted DNA-binding helix-hairpin-helix protein